MYSFNFAPVFANFGRLLEGAAVTMELSCGAMVLGLVISVICAPARTSHIAPLRWIVKAYVEVIRNTPFLVEIFFIYFGLPALGKPARHGDRAVATIERLERDDDGTCVGKGHRAGSAVVENCGVRHDNLPVACRHARRSSKSCVGRVGAVRLQGARRRLATASGEARIVRRRFPVMSGGKRRRGSGPAPRQRLVRNAFRMTATSSASWRAAPTTGGM